MLLFLVIAIYVGKIVIQKTPTPKNTLSLATSKIQPSSKYSQLNLDQKFEHLQKNIGALRGEAHLETIMVPPQKIALPNLQKQKANIIPKMIKSTPTYQRKQKKWDKELSLVQEKLRDIKDK